MGDSCPYMTYLCRQRSGCPLDAISLLANSIWLTGGLRDASLPHNSWGGREIRRQLVGARNLEFRTP